MPVKARCSARLGQVLLIGASMAALAGCGSLDGASRRVASAVTPYKVDVVQGNFVSREQVEALQPGMSRQQVRDILGTPLVTSLFHGDRWDYVFTMRRQRVEPQNFRLTLFFQGDVLERFEGDDMPSETEFVQRISRERKVKVPRLEATEEQLAKFPAAAGPAGAASAAPAAAQPAGSYPPLEPAR